MTHRQRWPKHEPKPARVVDPYDLIKVGDYDEGSWTMRQAAASSGLTKNVIWKLQQRQGWPYVQSGRERFIPKITLRRLVAAREPR